MTQRTFALTLVLSLAALGRLVPWSNPISFMLRNERMLAPSVDAESLLASGQPLPLDCADIPSLELIPGMSDRTAGELLHQRESIRRATRHKGFESSLQLARGIGEKTAPRVARYLSLDGICETEEPYSPLFPRSAVK
jgi:hypothetical protein